MLVRAAETFSAEPWRDEWWTTSESGTDALTHSKSVSGKRSRCPIMTTHVDDCDLDGAKALRTLVWESAVQNSLQMQIFFVAVGGAWIGTSSWFHRER